MPVPPDAHTGELTLPEMADSVVADPDVQEGPLLLPEISEILFPEPDVQTGPMAVSFVLDVREAAPGDAVPVCCWLYRVLSLYLKNFSLLLWSYCFEKDLFKEGL